MGVQEIHGSAKGTWDNRRIYGNIGRYMRDQWVHESTKEYMGVQGDTWQLRRIYGSTEGHMGVQEDRWEKGSKRRGR